MKKQADIDIKYLFFFSLIIFLFIISLVFAEHRIRTSSGGTSLTVNEDVQFSYNITVNITDSGPDANVTRVNITLQSPFNFTAGTNATDVPTFTVFTNTSGVLTWENSTYFVVNGSEIRYFTFNATIATPGNYVITVKTVNITGEYSSNISVTVNDTTIPSSIQFVSPSAANNSNLSQNTIAVNFSVTDNGNISMIVIRL